MGPSKVFGRDSDIALVEGSRSLKHAHASLPRGLIDTCIGLFCDSRRYSEFQRRPSEPEISEAEVVPKFKTLRDCGKPILALLARLSDAIRTRTGDFDLTMKRLDDLVTLATEKFYAFPFKDVPACWRELHREASLLKVSAFVVKGIWGHPNSQIETLHHAPNLEDGIMDEIVRTIDMTLIMAGPPSEDSTRDAIGAILQLLENYHSNSIKHDDRQPQPKRQKLNGTHMESSPDHFPTSFSFVPTISNAIPRLSAPSFDAFEQHMQHPRNPDLGPEPIIITGAFESWPARNEHPWKSPSYLMAKTIGGRRLVPIETGRSYVDEGWGQKILTFKEFMDQYILQNPTSSALALGYLAQHDLFAQVPSLRLDIAIPDYCYTTPPPPHYSSPLANKYSQIPQLDAPLLNAWFGPAGTISPLHTDPYHNILAQVVGKKYIRLYAPGESGNLYARGVEDGGIDMGNTSATDVGVLAGWDGTKHEQSEAHEKFPQFKEARYMDCILEEGECLYIPVGWWHYVRSLSISFSVSFWFN